MFLFSGVILSNKRFCYKIVHILLYIKKVFSKNCIYLCISQFAGVYIVKCRLSSQVANCLFGDSYCTR